jgi:tetratricopeptide (TPR) repeat protein
MIFSVCHSIVMPIISPAETSSVERAEFALELVGRDPRLALAEADAVVEVSAREHDVVALSRAHRAAGLALRELGDLPTAEARLRAAVRRAGHVVEVAAEARMSLAFILLDRGRLPAALGEADRAAAGVTGIAAVRVACQRALILQRTGRLDDALDEYASALPALRRADDALWAARVHNNRGLLHTHRGSLTAAEADFGQAAALYRSLGMDLLVAESECNVGNVAALRGDAPRALAAYERAECAPVLKDKPKPQLLLNRCRVLLSVGLTEEARRVAERAVAELRAVDQQADLAEAQLLLAEATAANGSPDIAEAEARAAHTAFSRQGRPGWALLARLVELRAAESTDADPHALVRAARRCATDLSAAGWHIAELDALLIAATAAVRDGDLDTSRELLASASRARGSGQLEVRVRGWRARALLRNALDDRRGALAAIRAGLVLIEEQQAVLGATDMRAHVAAFGAELASLGLDMAIASGRARSVLAWAERWRARTSRLRPVRPPSEPELAGALTDLRLLTVSTARARLNGEPGPPVTERLAAEERVTRASRLAQSQLHRPAGPPPSVADLAADLGDAVLVEYIQRDAQLLAVTVRRGRCRLVRIAAMAEVSEQIDVATSAQRALALAFGTPRGRRSIRQAMDSAGRALDDLLFGAVNRDIGDSRLVIVPTGGLHAVPWGLLGTVAGRPVSISPSAATWLQAATAPESPGTGTVLAAGPGLPVAAEEVTAIAEHHPSAAVFRDQLATVPAVLAAIDGADLAHIAAHGVLRTDNPLLSALRLADGPLTVYDLERIRRAPRTVVLPACQSGVNTVRAGDELLGLVSALLALGTHTVVAATVPVSDAATKPVMLALHERLARGADPSDALAATRTTVDTSDDVAVAVASSFVCFGA